jgi:ADP-heptose:LPS heptosyltransferase
VSGGTVAIRLRALGDLVLTTAALRSLALGAPGEPLHVVTEARFAGILAGHPHVTRVWPVERTDASTRATIAGLRRERPRLAVDFFGNARSALIARGSGAARVFGYALRGRRHLYTDTVPREERYPGDRREPAAAVHLRLARAAGGAPTGPESELRVAPAAAQAARALFAQAGVTAPGRTVGLVVAGSWPTKMWPLSHSAVLARHLLAAGHGVLALVGPGEAGLAARLTALAPGVAVLPDCGTGALAAVIAELRAVVGTDSGPRHLAAALGVPSFAWFGPTHPDTWNPPGAAHGHWRTALPCRGCDRTRCPHWNCLPGLAPEAGARLVLDHLERHGREAAGVHPAAGA